MILPEVESQVERPVTKRAEVEAVVAKSEVVVASVNRALVKVPRAEKKESDEVAEVKVVEPVESKSVRRRVVPVAWVKAKVGMVTMPVVVSAVRMEEEAAVRIWKAVDEFTGVWKREVP